MVGSLVAWLITVVTIKPTTEDGSASGVLPVPTIGSTVMHDVNRWSMAAAFLLGLVLTLPLMIGRVRSNEDQREDS